MTVTTFDKSKHLLELGLDPDSADMYYTGHRSIHNPKEIEYTQEPRVRTKFVSFDRLEVFFPAWSLSALLEVMPMVNEGWPVCCKIYGSEKWHVLYHSTAVTPKIDSGEYDTPIEAAYEMVCLLLEQGLIKKIGEQ